MGPVERAIRSHLFAGQRLHTPSREAPFTVSKIDEHGVELLLGKQEAQTRLSWECLEGIAGYLADRDWVRIGSRFSNESTPGTLDAYVKQHIRRAPASYVAALLEEAGVVNIDSTPPAHITLRASFHPPVDNAASQTTHAADQAPRPQSHGSSAGPSTPTPARRHRAKRKLVDHTAASGTRAVWVSRSEDGGLLIEGQDLGSGVEGFWGAGSSEYEWAIIVAPQDLPALAELLGTTVEGIRKAIVSRFSGDAAFGLRGFLDDHGLVAERWSWIS